MMERKLILLNLILSSKEEKEKIALTKMTNTQLVKP